MKTPYTKLFLPAVILLIIIAFFQNAKAGTGIPAINKISAIGNHAAAPDTPRLVYKKQKRKKIDKDIEREDEKLEDGVDENVLAREHQEFLRLKDPNLNIVPVERLIEAKRVKEQMNIRRPAANLSDLNSGPQPSLSTLQWNERGPSNVGGRTRALIFDLKDSVNGYKKVFAGGVGGGLWFTNDITATPVQWNKINDFFDNIAISCIAQNPVNHQEIYAGTGEGFFNGDAIQGLGVWKSADGGATWTRLTSTAAFTNINAILVDKNGGVYIGGVGYGIQKSADGGATFNPVITGVDGADLQLAANGDIYAATGVFSTGRVMLSDATVHGANVGNSGTWTDITPAPNGTAPDANIDWWRVKLCVAPSNPNAVYALFEGFNTYSLTSVQKYNKATNTWAVKTVPPGTTFNNGQAWYSIAAAVDPNNENVLYAGSLDAGKSIDGGTTWHTVTQWYVGQVSGLSASQYVHADHHAFTFAPGSSDRFLMGTDGGIFYTQNASNNVSPYAAFADKNNGYNVTQFYSVALHPTNYNFALAGAQDNSTQEFTAAGINATTSVIGGDGAFSFIDQLNGNVQIGSYVYSNYYFSTNGGATFSSATSSNYGQFINPTDYDSKLKSLYAGSAAGYYFRINSVPSTADVHYVHVNGFNSGNVTAVTVAPITANRVFFGLDNGTVVRVDSANVGTEKTSVILKPNPSVSATVSCIAIDPSTESHILVSYFNYGVVSIFETKNATAATPVWTQVEGNLPDMPVRWVLFHPEDHTRVLIATELGIWSTDLLNGASTTWTPTNSGLANVRVDMIKYRAADRTLAAATHGRGLFTSILPLSGTATLSKLTISSGTLTPAFSSGTLTYTASVANAISAVTVTPTFSITGETIKVNNVAVASGTPSQSIPLVVGANVISIQVIAPNANNTKTYNITVTRAGSSVATLSSLALSAGTLNPVFNTATTGYTASVPNSVSSIAVTPAVTDPAATIKVNGTAVASGSASGAIALNAGDNVINIVVTAQDGTTMLTYVVTVNRAVNPPNIAYATPNIYKTAIPVSLPPTNTGGAVPATIYSTVTTLAGSGLSGSANGTGAAATFKGLLNMATDAAGNIYAADYAGNVIRKVTPAGVATTLAGSGVAGSTNGTGTAATFNGPAGIGIDASGNIYVGDSGNNLIRKITPAGVVTTFAGSGVAGNTNGTGTAAAFRNPRGLIVDGAGNIYVADMSNNRIRKITPAAVVTTFAGSGVAGSVNGTGTAATFNGPISLGTDGANNIYVSEYISNLIRKITPAGVVSTFAGNGAGAADGTGTAASFRSPYGFATDGSNNLYIADRGNNKIRKISPAGVVTTLAGSGTLGSANGVGTAAQFNDPRGVAFYQGTLFVADYAGHQVRNMMLTGYSITPGLPAGLTLNSANGVISGTPTAVSAATNYTVTGANVTGSSATTVNITVNAGLAAPNIAYATPQTFNVGTAANVLPTNTGGAVPATVFSAVSILAGSGTSGSANGTGTAATFKGLMNMATDAAGNIYAADYTGNVIRKITTAGVATTFAGSGTAGNADGTGTAATFNGPLGIVVDAGGNIYVGDSGNNIIRKITPGGVVTTFAGSGIAGNANGTGTVATFRSPRGLAVDASGNIYVADMSNNLVRKITPDAAVTTFAGSGAAGSINGTGTAATFNAPIALATDGSDNIYVAEYTSSLIRKITPGGVVTTFAGSVAGAADGTGTAASFKNPYAISTDASNNLYVADAGNNIIRKITPAAVVTTLAGSGTAGSTSGVGTAAKFNAPHGVVFYQGNLYVADFGGHQVRKVVLTGYTLSPALPAGLVFTATTGQIGGTPTATSAAADYTIIAYNATGSNGATINITVNAMGAIAFAEKNNTAADAANSGAPNIRQGLSPNGDGIADVLIIDNIEKYPDNKIAIMNSGGGLVYEAKGYNNLSVAFNGHSTKNGKLQRAGTYFYRLDYKDGDKTKHKTGFILLKY